MRQDNLGVIHVWEKHRNVPLFPIAEATDKLPVEQAPTTTGPSPKGELKDIRSLEKQEAKPTLPDSKVTLVDVRKTSATELAIDRRRRRNLSLHLLILAGGRWRIEFRRSGRPPGLAWESLVEPDGRLQFSVVEERLAILWQGKVTHVDLITLDEVPASVQVDGWDATVSWSKGEVFVNGRDIQVFRDGESTNVEL